MACKLWCWMNIQVADVRRATRVHKFARPTTGAGGATSGGVAPTVKGPGYGQTMPGHNADGGFRPVLNAGPDLSEVTQPGLGQGNTFVTSWDDMRKK